MTELNDLTIHTFRNLKLASPTISQLEQRQHLAQLICQPQTNPAKIHQTHPWTEQHPIKQIRQFFFSRLPKCQSSHFDLF